MYWYSLRDTITLLHWYYDFWLIPDLPGGGYWWPLFPDIVSICSAITIVRCYLFFFHYSGRRADVHLVFWWPITDHLQVFVVPYHMVTILFDWPNWQLFYIVIDTIDDVFHCWHCIDCYWWLPMPMEGGDVLPMIIPVMHWWLFIVMFWAVTEPIHSDHSVITV